MKATHKPVTTILDGPNNTATVHFHCPCGTNRRELVITGASPIERFTSAIRAMHARGAWPAPADDLGDAETAGWGPPAWDDTAA